MLGFQDAARKRLPRKTRGNQLKVGTDMSVHLYQKFRGLTNDLDSSGNLRAYYFNTSSP
jgi:hypothetical protein